MKTKYTISIAVILIVVLNIAILTADNLSGKFFGPTIPIISGYYVNDFLFFGIILSLGLGVLLGNWHIKFIKNQDRGNALVGMLVLVIASFIYYTATKFQGSLLDDYDSFGNLLRTWAITFLVSGIFIPVSRFTDRWQSNQNINK